MKIKTFEQRYKEKVQAHLELRTYMHWFTTFLWFPRFIEGNWCWLELVERQPSWYALHNWERIQWNYRLIKS